MSWFKRKREFSEETDILAEDFEAEFDWLAEVFNGLLQADRVSASGDLALKSGYQDVPGTETKITAVRPSLLLVSAYFAFWLPPVHVNGKVCGTLRLDSTDQPAVAEEKATSVNTETEDRATPSQGYVLSLTEGTHTLKLRAEGTSGTAKQTSTGFIYLLIPDPEP